MKTVLLHLAGAKSSRILQNSHLTAKFHYSKAATGVGFLTILKKANFLLYEQNYRFFLFVFFLFSYLILPGADITISYTSSVTSLGSGTYDNITLERGAFVEINSANINMNTNCSITINKGAVLKISNSTITHTGSGTNLWTGIIIIGDENSYQVPQNYNSNSFFYAANDNYTTMQHGLLYCENSTLTYAVSAVNSSGSSGGGCININHCIFDNNVNSITLTNYSKYHQTSLILNTQFLNTIYLPTGSTYYHIILKDASISNSSFLPVYDPNMYYALEIGHCIFNNDKLNSNLCGINSIGSYFSIYESYFLHFSVGMNVTKGVYFYPGASVSHCGFIECDRAIIATGLYTFNIWGSNFDVDRFIHFNVNNNVVPNNLPFGIYIAGNSHYSISNCIFEKSINNNFTGKTLGSYGIIADGNASNGGNIIRDNTFTTLDIGVQNQNESKATFLKCNKFSLGSASTATYNYDITIPSGTLMPHNGCGGTTNYIQAPGNTFSPNPVNSQRNIYVKSTSYKPNNRFLYKYGTGFGENPQYFTASKVKSDYCPIPSNCGSISSVPASFEDNYNAFIFNRSRFDSLHQANSTDTADIEITGFYKNHFCNEMTAGIKDTNQFDSAIALLVIDTNFLAKYSLMLAYIGSGNYNLAGQVLANLNDTNPEEGNIKKLYALLLPIYANYNFDSLEAKRGIIDSLTHDSDFAARQAKYIVNYIDGTNAEIAGMDNFVPQYLDSILPVDGMDTTVTTGIDYEVLVYPNPFTSQVQADIKNNSGNDQTIKMKLYNSFGTELLNTDGEIKNTETQTLKIETGDLTYGFYFLQFSDKDDVVFESRIIFKLP